MCAISCPIWESCKNKCTSDCFNCEENDCVEEIKGNFYEFNNWEDDENEEN